MMDRLRFRGLSFFLSAAVKGFASKGEICYNRYMDWCGWIGFLLCPGRENTLWRFCRAVRFASRQRLGKIDTNHNCMD